MRKIGVLSIVGERIGDLRRQKGITQEKLAEALGFTTNKVHKIEQGITNVRINDLAAIAKYFECDVDYLMGQQDAPNKEYQHFSEKTGLSEKAVSVLISAQKAGDPIINIINSLLLEDSGILVKLWQASTADYGEVSTFIDIDDPFSPNGKTSILISPRRLRQADSMELYNMLLKFIASQREENEMPSL